MIDKRFGRPAVSKLDGGFAATLDRVLRRLDREPRNARCPHLLAGHLKGRMGGDAFRFIVAKFYLNDRTISLLPKLLDDLEKGRRPGSLYFNLRQMFSNAISLTWFTTDTANGAGEDLLRRISGQRRNGLLRDAMNFRFRNQCHCGKCPTWAMAFASLCNPVSQCCLWRARSMASHRRPNPRPLPETFPNARLVVVENSGHASQLRARAPGLAKAMAEFMAGRTVDATFAIPPHRFAALK